MGKFQNITEYVVPEYFFASFLVGLLYTFLTSPEATIVMKHPTPYNLDTTTYRDKQSNCYRYRASRTTCPTDQSKIVKYDFV